MARFIGMAHRKKEKKHTKKIQFRLLSRNLLPYRRTHTKIFQRFRKIFNSSFICLPLHSIALLCRLESGVELLKSRYIYRLPSHTQTLFPIRNRFELFRSHFKCRNKKRWRGEKCISSFHRFSPTFFSGTSVCRYTQKQKQPKLFIGESMTLTQPENSDSSLSIK